MTPRKAYSPDDDARIKDMVRSGAPKLAIAEALGRSACSIEFRIGILRRDGQLPRERGPAGRGDVPVWSQDQALLFRDKVATLRHLLDLKRAGHSPTRTELCIPPGDNVRHYATPVSRSYLGSSAAICAEG